MEAGGAVRIPSRARRTCFVTGSPRMMCAAARDSRSNSLCERFAVPNIHAPETVTASISSGAVNGATRVTVSVAFPSASRFQNDPGT